MNTVLQIKPHRILSLLFILLFVPLAAAAANPEGQPGAAANGEEGAQVIQRPMDSVTISKKSLEKITTNIGDTYALSRATIIVGLDGHQVSIRKMLVPCDAEVTYTIDQGVRRAQRIKMLRIGRNPTWQWTSDLPE